MASDGEWMWPEEVAEALGLANVGVLHNLVARARKRRRAGRPLPTDVPMPVGRPVRRRVPAPSGTHGDTRVVSSRRWRRAEVLQCAQVRRARAERAS